MSDRTASLLQRSQPYRQSLDRKYKDRFIAPRDVASREQSYMDETVQVHFCLVQSGQKLEALRAAMKSSSLFNSQHERIKTLADAVDLELKQTQERLESLHEPGAEEIHATIKETLHSRLFSLTKDFKQVLQARTKALRAAEEKKKEFTSARSYQSTAVRAEPSFMEDSEQTQQTQEELSFLQARAEGVEHVEKQLAELSTVFERMSMIVHEHQLMLERIDANTDAALLHLEQGKQEVVKYHDSVTNSRNLFIKVFMIFILFFAFYVVFLV